MLRRPRGYVSGAACDPIEKKPFFHAFPGRDALTFGMLGCDLHCGYCQNWITSQTLRDDRSIAPPESTEPERLVEAALSLGAPVIASSYNEPLITSDWAVEVFRAARRPGLRLISNGNATPEVLEFLRPFVDLYKVDLKGFREEAYRRLGGRLGTVLETIRRLKEMARTGWRSSPWWSRASTTPPGSCARSRSTSAGVDPDIPWHVTAFHPDYKMQGPEDTSAETLTRAAAIGREAGLRFVYAGNLPGALGDLENTRCPQCRTLLIERWGFRVMRNRLTSGGACPDCGTLIPGIWSPESRPLDHAGLLVHNRCG